MVRRDEVITKLMEYGILQHSLYKGLFVVGIVIYFLVVAGIPVYTTVLRDPGVLGKMTLLALMLLLSAVLAEIVQHAVYTTQAKIKRKKTSQLELRSRILMILTVFAIIVMCYVLICIYRVY